MSARLHELQFAGQYWRAALNGDALSWRAQSLVDPIMVEDPKIAAFYAITSRRYTKGEPIRLEDLKPDLEEAQAWDLVIELSDVAIHTSSLIYHGEQVVRHYQAREQLRWCRVGVEEAEKSLENPERAKRVAERLTMRLLDCFANEPSNGKPQTRDELIDDQLDRMDREEERGITLPWPKLQDACGPWMPGEVIGITGFSGSGKSTFTANLAMGLARRGVPVISFPTEMGRQWVARCGCALSRFPQLLAEKDSFRKATPEQRAAFRRHLDEARTWPWEMVNRSNVTPSELIAAVRTLRRQWPEQTVVVVVDHMHRLDYGAEEADAEAGKATKLLKNLAGDDSAGLVFVCLYQPKKPEQDRVIYEPIHGNRIRGHSSIWNELDVHLSIYRAWAEKSAYGRTEWGDEAVDLKADGSPKVAKPFAKNAVLDSEHVYLKPDKRRVGGEGPPLWLNIHKPSGQIFELANERQLYAV